MTTLSEYQGLILGWARDRNLIEGSTPDKQLDKLFEELGEYAGASARSANPDKRDEMVVKMKDGMGDTFVVLCILAEQLGIELDLDNVQDYLSIPTNSVMYLAFGCVAGVVAARAEGLRDSSLNDPELIRNAIGVAKTVSEDRGFDFLECVGIAWNEIKDRKGRMIDGVFIKEADL